MISAFISDDSYEKLCLRKISSRVSDILTIIPENILILTFAVKRMVKLTFGALGSSVLENPG